MRLCDSCPANGDELDKSGARLASFCQLPAGRRTGLDVASMRLRGAPDARESRILPEYWHFDGLARPAYRDFYGWAFRAPSILSGVDEPNGRTRLRCVEAGRLRARVDAACRREAR
jgi:hypothetical protein